MHTLPKLTYKYDALEPYLDKETMEIHYSKHHQTYVDKLNATIKDHKDLEKKSAEDLIKNLSIIPNEIRAKVKNFGGGHVNHTFLWPLMKKDVQFKGEIAEAIKKRFGSFEKFKEEFSNTAITLFGSGWAWLVLNNGELEIITTPNQDSPLSQGKIPLLAIDVWEHQYYLKWRSNRAGFVAEYFNVVNWEKVNEHYKKAK